MAKVQVFGMDIFLANMQKMSTEARNINKGALGEGAKVAAEKLRDAIETLPIRPDKYTGRQHTERFYGVTESEYIQILDNFGIARFHDSGGAWNTSIGFKGYVNTPSAKFNDHVPTGLLVQAVEYGTQFRKPARVLSRATRAAESEIRDAMQKYIDDKVQQIMEE